jgi:hypothetical protein
MASVADLFVAPTMARGDLQVRTLPWCHMPLMAFSMVRRAAPTQARIVTSLSCVRHPVPYVSLDNSAAHRAVNTDAGSACARLRHRSCRRRVSWLYLPEQTLTHAPGGDLRATAKVELLADIADVRLSRPLCDHERLRDHLV